MRIKGKKVFGRLRLELFGLCFKSHNIFSIDYKSIPPYLQQRKLRSDTKIWIPLATIHDLRKKIILVYILKENTKTYIWIYILDIFIRDQTTLNQCYTYRLLHSF